MPPWINIRHEVRGMTRGDSRTVPQGKWIVIRIMRIGQYSTHWNPLTQESIGGPKWLYDDFVIRAVSKPGPLQIAVPGVNETTTTIAGTAGIEDIIDMTYAIEVLPEFPRLPVAGDRIYEITKYAGKTRPIPPLVSTAMYEVIDAISEIGDYGRPEVVYVLCKRRAGES